MNPKVVRLVGLVEEGFDVRGVESHRDGSIRLEVALGPDRRRFDFAFYEIPAVLHATKLVGIAG